MDIFYPIQPTRGGNILNLKHINGWSRRKGRAEFLSVLLLGTSVALVSIPTVAQAGQVGRASWYGPGFHGKPTASGQRFNQNQLTAAHRSLPLGTRAKVTNLQNGRVVEVTINDRGPFIRGRIIDLSRAAARRISMGGTARVSITAMP